MTHQETASTLSDEALLGFNLAMARDELKGVFLSGQGSMEESHELVESFAGYLHDIHFGENAHGRIEDLDVAAEALSTQVRCVVGDDTWSIEDIKLRMKEYDSEDPEASLSGVFQFTLFDMLKAHWDEQSDPHAKYMQLLF